VPGARGGRARQAHQPRSQAARARSVDALHGQVQPRRQDRRQGPLAHRLRRLRRDRRGRRRHGPQERSLVDVRVNNPSDLYHKGDDVEAIILSINHDEKKVSLGIKQLWDDPWPSMLTEFPMGRVFDDGKVISVVDYGVFVELREGVEASCRHGRTSGAEGGKIKVGDKVKCEISSRSTPSIAASC
jgi:hypothetical protein